MKKKIKRVRTLPLRIQIALSRQSAIDNQAVKMGRSSLNRITQSVRNKNYESDVKYAIKLNTLLLNAIGIWPVNSSSLEFDKLVSIISPIICCILFIIRVIPSIIKLLFDLNTVEAKLNFVWPVFALWSSLNRYYHLLVHGEEIKMCIDTVINDWRGVNVQKEREIMIRNARIARGLTITCVLFMFVSGIFHGMFVPLLATAALLRGNVTYRILAYNGNFFFFDAHVPPYYYVVFFLQIMFGGIVYAVSSGTCSLAAKFIMHICGQCQIIRYLLENLVDDGDDFSATLGNRVAAIIIRHLHVLKFMSRVEELLNEMCLVEFLGCTLNMCLLGYYCITCQEIGEASYMIDWYRLPRIQARLLVLLIAIGNRPVKLTAGKLVDLSIVTFSNVVKTSIAYLNMLRKTTSS